MMIAIVIIKIYDKDNECYSFNDKGYSATKFTGKLRL